MTDSTWTAARVEPMVSVILVFQCKVGDVEQPWLYKRVNMPSVPIRGTAVWLHSFDADWEWGTDALFVTRTAWWEGSGDVDGEA